MGLLYSNFIFQVSKVVDITSVFAYNPLKGTIWVPMSSHSNA